MRSKSAHVFTRSHQVAIRFLIDLINGKIHDESLPTPVLRNFDWFERIFFGRVDKVGTDVSNASRYNKLTRSISFYGYRGTLVAEVWLAGNEFKNSDGSKPTFWRVVKIKYRREFDESRTFVEPDWVEAEVSENLCPLS